MACPVLVLLDGKANPGGQGSWYISWAPSDAPAEVARTSGTHLLLVKTGGAAVMQLARAFGCCELAARHVILRTQEGVSKSSLSTDLNLYH